MKRIFLTVCAVGFTVCLCGWNTNELVQISTDGDLLDEGGRHAVWIGTDCSGGSVSQPQRGGKAFRGRYDEKFRWMYETNVTAEQLKRIGWNILSTATSDTNIRAIFPEYNGFSAKDPCKEYEELLAKYDLNAIRPFSLTKRLMPLLYEEQVKMWESLRGGMPVFLQMQGGVNLPLREQKRFEGILPMDRLYFGGANNGGGAIAVQIGTEEGKDLYRKMYIHRQEEALSYNVRPFAYKLFNEGIYWNYSDLNKKLFAKAMKKRHGTIEKLNARWKSNFKCFDEVAVFKGEGGACKAQDVEYHKFQQKQLTELCAYLKQELRKRDKDAKIMIQMHGADSHLRTFTHYDLAGLEKILDTISTGTGNNSLKSFMNFDDDVPFKDLDKIPSTIRNYYSKDSFYTAIADGKPLMNTEAYSENSYDGFHRMLWHEFASGKECVIQWAWFGLNWGPGVTKPFSFALMNPNACPPEAFAAIDDVRKELESVGDIFLPRRNMQKAEVAALFSYPTLRFNHNLQEPELTASSAPLQIQIPVDTIFEEQLCEDRQSRYKVLLASGIHNVYDETNEHLRKWIERGGVLIVNQGLLNKDEYGFDLKNPLLPFSVKKGDGKVARIEPMGIRMLCTEELAGGLDSSWNVVGRLNGKPAHVYRKIEKGEVHVILGSLTDFGYASMIRPILRKAGVGATAEITNPVTGDSVPGIEVRRFREGTFTGWYFCNMNEMPKQVLFDAAELDGKAIVNPFEKESYQKENGKVLLILPAKAKRFVLVSGEKREIEKRFGALPSRTNAQRIEQFNAEAAKLRAQNANVRRSVHVDISKVANGGFYNYQNYKVDSVWQEGGVKELKSFPYHESVFGDLKFDVIRFDYNENRTCIQLKSKVNPNAPENVNVPLNGKYRSVAFLMAVTHGMVGEKVMDVTFNYADGTKVVAPIRVGKEIGDWILAKNGEALLKKCVWKTVDGNYGVFVHEWENPKAGVPLVSIDFISATPSSNPLVAAITAVPSDFKKEFKNLYAVDKDNVAKVIRGSYDKEKDAFVFSHQLRIELSKPFVIPQEKLKEAVLRFQVRNEPDAWGVVREWTYLPLGLEGMIKGEPAVSIPGVSSRTTNLIDGIFKKSARSELFVEIELPLSEMISGKSRSYAGNLDAITAISFGAWGKLPYSRTVKNIRIEY